MSPKCTCGAFFDCTKRDDYLSKDPRSPVMHSLKLYLWFHFFEQKATEYLMMHHTGTIYLRNCMEVNAYLCAF